MNGPDFETPQKRDFKLKEQAERQATEPSEDSATEQTASEEAGGIMERSAELTPTAQSLKEPRKDEPSLPPPLVRKKFRPLRLVDISLWLLFLPIIVLAGALISDPEALNSWQAEMHKYDRDRLPYLEKAISIRPDQENLLSRAWAYEQNGQGNKSLADLNTLVKQNVGNGQVYQYLAARLALWPSRQAQVINLLHKSVDLSLAHCQSFPIDFYRDDANLDTSLYDLLSYGDPRTIAQIKTIQPHGALGRQELNLLKILAARQSGRSKQALELLHKLPRINIETDASGQEIIFFAPLLAMDNADWHTAEKLLDRADSRESEVNRIALSALDRAWILYNKQDYVGALKESTSALYKAEHYTHQIHDQQEIHATYLLRANVYKKLGKNKEAAADFAIYKKHGLSGSLYIPKPYQQLINESASVKI